jgi:hypothetical protein
MCCVVSIIYCFVVYNYFNNAKRFLWYIGSYILFAAHMGSLYAVCPSGLFFDASPGFAGNFYVATYALVSMFMSFSGEINLRGSYSANYKYIRAYGYLCLVSAAIFFAAPDSHLVYCFAAATIMTLPPLVYAGYLSFQLVKVDSRAFIPPFICYFLMITASLADLLLPLAGYRGIGFRIISLALFSLANAYVFCAKYNESIANTDQLSESLAQTLEKIKHSDNALMCTRMNPDFLYESLALIRSRCNSDTFAAEELTVSLSKYLRHTLSFQQLQGIVPISNEIELTKAYINIKRAENPGISFEMNLPDDMADFNIPPLSIQPLVENAIEHGFSGRDRTGKITVTILNYDSFYHIDVSDNGAGMDEETISRVTERAAGTAKVGLFNIHARLIGLFGKGLVIQSAKGVGTSVSFVVPPTPQATEETEVPV